MYRAGRSPAKNQRAETECGESENVRRRGRLICVAKYVLSAAHHAEPDNAGPVVRIVDVAARAPEADLIGKIPIPTAKKERLTGRVIHEVKAVSPRRNASISPVVVAALPNVLTHIGKPLRGITSRRTLAPNICSLRHACRGNAAHRLDRIPRIAPGIDQLRLPPWQPYTLIPPSSAADSRWHSGSHVRGVVRGRQSLLDRTLVAVRHRFPPTHAHHRLVVSIKVAIGPIHRLSDTEAAIATPPVRGPVRSGTRSQRTGW